MATHVPSIAEARRVGEPREVSSKYYQSGVVPLMVEQVATWVGAPTIFALRVCLKARPLLRIRYGKARPRLSGCDSTLQRFTSPKVECQMLDATPIPAG